MAARVSQRDSAFAHFKIRLSLVLPQCEDATYELNPRRQVDFGVMRLWLETFYMRSQLLFLFLFLFFVYLSASLLD